MALFDELKSHWDGVAGLLTIIGGFTSIPIIASLASLEPPWPPAIGYVSALLVLVAALLVRELAQGRAINRRRLMKRAAWLTVTGLLVYLVLYSIFIETVPGTDERVVRGFTCTAEAQLVHGERCPDLSRDALRDAEWDAMTLWTRSSVTVARVGLAIAWLVFMTGLISALSAIVAGRAAKEPAGARP